MLSSGEGFFLAFPMKRELEKKLNERKKSWEKKAPNTFILFSSYFI